MLKLAITSWRDFSRLPIMMLDFFILTSLPLPDIYRMTALLRLRMPLPTDPGNANSSTQGLPCTDRRAERRKCGFRCHPDAPLPWFLIERIAAMLPHALRPGLAAFWWLHHNDCESWLLTCPRHSGGLSE